MSTHLSRYFAERRREAGRKPGELARLAGCGNVEKNGGRIRTFELTGRISRELFERLARILEIDGPTIERLVEQDRQEFFARWLAWVNEPIKPYLVIRLIPGIYSRRGVPTEITTLEEAETWASSVAAGCSRHCSLVWTRRISSWFDGNGVLLERTEAVPGEPNTPWMSVQGKGRPFLLGDGLRPGSLSTGPTRPPIGPEPSA